MVTASSPGACETSVEIPGPNPRLAGEQGAPGADRFGSDGRHRVHERTSRADEAELVARLRAGDEEVVQEAWLGFLQSVDRFEGRSSLKTFILAILVNKAKTRGVREARSTRSRAARASARRTVVIWCRTFSAPFGSARLRV
jgi:Sigma-70 region 2